MDKYKPIDCGIYDQLELFAMRKSKVKIEIINGSIIHTTIKNLISESSNGEFLITDQDQRIRLDQMASINDLPIKLECSPFIK